MCIRDRAINVLLLIVLTFTFSKRSRVMAMLALREGLPVHGLIVEDTVENEPPWMPMYYLGQWQATQLPEPYPDASTGLREHIARLAVHKRPDAVLFIGLEDDLMRLFGSDKIVKYMEKMGLEEGQELEHPLLNRSIGQAQKRVEQHNFQQRKRTLEYDDVMNKQREVIYGFRNEIINSDDVRDRLMDIMEEIVIQKVEQHTKAEYNAE